MRYIEKCEEDAKKKQQQSEERILSLEKEIEALKDKLAGAFSRDLATQAKKIGNINVLAAEVNGLDGKALRSAMDHLKQQLGSAVIVLATVKAGKAGVICGVTADLVDRYNARDIINQVATQIGGKGGGRADLAEAGGNQPEALAKALQSIYTWMNDNQSR